MTTTDGLTLEELERRAYANGDVVTAALIRRAESEASNEALQDAYDSGYDAGKTDGYSEGYDDGLEGDS